MRTTTIKWQETRSEPGYNNKTCGIEIALADGDFETTVLERAKRFVHNALTSRSPDSDDKKISEAIQQLENAILELQRVGECGVRLSSIRSALGAALEALRMRSINTA